MRRRTEELLLELRTLLGELDSGLDEQIAAVPDLDVVRRTLPHWLNHVVAGFVRDRLAEWRLSVLADLRDVRVAEEAMEDVELLLPSLHPAPIHGDAAWGRRLGVTATVGGGFALMAFGTAFPLAIPIGAAAVLGGVAWGTIGRGARKSEARRKLAESARTALRRMGQDAEVALRDQYSGFEDQLAALATQHEATVREERAVVRDELQARQAFHRARLAKVRAVRRELDEQVRSVLPEAAQGGA
jgi:hypothetical protein